MAINVQTVVAQISLVLINASVILDSKRLKIKKDVSTLTNVIWKTYAKMDSVEIPQDHTNVTAIQELSSNSIAPIQLQVSENLTVRFFAIPSGAGLALNISSKIFLKAHIRL